MLIFIVLFTRTSGTRFQIIGRRTSVLCWSVIVHVAKFLILSSLEPTEKQVANDLSMIRSKIRRLPGIHQATLRAMLEHLAKVSANQKYNKMDAKNLAVVFGPVLMGDETPVAGLDILTMPKVSVFTIRARLMQSLDPRTS